MILVSDPTSASQPQPSPFPRIQLFHSLYYHTSLAPFSCPKTASCLCSHARRGHVKRTMRPKQGILTDAAGAEGRGASSGRRQAHRSQTYMWRNGSNHEEMQRG